MNLRVRRSVWLPGAFALACLIAGCTQLSDYGLGGTQVLDERTVAAGLKEALSLGTDRTVARTGVRDGYFGNALLRIALPPAVQDMSATLRLAGLGGKLDELELAMNRAAESAAGEAKALFLETITGLTLQDVWGILKGHDTAATDFLRARTAAALSARYRPIIRTRLQAVGGYSDYEELVALIEALPLVDPPQLDLVDYVTERALAGLFTVLGEEEQRIRTDPLARTTALLRRVFAEQ
jgi:hypothetical protein